jgi:transporter family-2 protein
MPLILVAIIVGFALPVQAGINAQLRLALGHPLTTAFASFLVGTLALGVLLLVFRVPIPAARVAAQTPVWHWTGGFLGAAYIAVAVILAPRLGAATMIASVVAGQMLASLLLDHFGLVGFARQAATPGRLLGAGLVIVGVRLLQR